MTSQEAKEWLLRGWNLDDEIDELDEARVRAYTRCTSVTARIDSIPGGGGGTPSDNGMATYTELAIKINYMIDELARIKMETLEAISKMKNSKLRTVLIARYVNFKQWEEIATDMHYTYQNVCHLHGVALEDIKDLI